MASALRKHHRKNGRTFTPSDLARVESDLRQLGPITFACLTRLIGDVLACPKTYPTYDAAYVVLARDRAIPLCSLDAVQGKCAVEEGVELLIPGTPEAQAWLLRQGFQPQSGTP